MGGTLLGQINNTEVFMLKKFSHLVRAIIVLIVSFVAFYAFADEVVVSPQDFFAQVLEAIRTFGGLSVMAKISAVVMIIISSMKVSFFRELIWDKLGALQTWVAPILGLIAGILGLGNGDAPITLASVMAYVAAGGGAIILHELLDSIKAIPGIGQVYISMINLIQGFLTKKP